MYFILLCVFHISLFFFFFFFDKYTAGYTHLKLPLNEVHTYLLMHYNEIICWNFMQVALAGCSFYRFCKPMQAES